MDQFLIPKYLYVFFFSGLKRAVAVNHLQLVGLSWNVGLFLHGTVSINQYLRGISLHLSYVCELSKPIS